ncbi:MAG: phospho-N-acetylmuramoyl-pentapeptide-transferase [Verrucomicrobiota bacterium]|nr:phospho-N-acetylmuramoyl-pentapeptide-transferase [Verrucomicrobiota bacterium]
MFYYFSFLEDSVSWFRLFEYITVRTLGAATFGFIIMLLIGPYLIKKLKKINFVELDVDQRLGENFKTSKVRTPTMGGIIIISSTFISTLLWANPSNIFLLLTLGTFIVMGFIGFVDDYKKIKSKNGLSVKNKSLFQILWTFVFLSILWSSPETQDQVKKLMVPFNKMPILEMSFIFSFIFLILVMVGASNAVNLTDGLDGLAIGCTNSVIGCYLLLSYIAGHYSFATYLQVPFISGCGELTVFCGALLGSGLGFLWFNRNPAEIFMGDTGSLALGGAIASVAILIKQELLLIFVGGVFVIEALSVIIQTVFFKYSRFKTGKGRRIFKCAPIHHHFEFVEKEKAIINNKDPKYIENIIVVKFWIAGIICALIGIATLKIR